MTLDQDIETVRDILEAPAELAKDDRRKTRTIMKDRRPSLAALDRIKAENKRLRSGIEALVEKWRFEAEFTRNNGGSADFAAFKEDLALQLAALSPKEDRIQARLREAEEQTEYLAAQLVRGDEQAVRLAMERDRYMLW